MKIFNKRFAGNYLDSYLVPAEVALLLLAGATINAAINWEPLELLTTLLLFLFSLALLGILFASAWNLFQKRWRKGIINFLTVPALFFAFGTCAGLLFMSSWLAPSGDGFADNLSIPEDIEIFDPLDWEWGSKPQAEEADPFQARLLAVLKAPGGGDPSVTVRLPSLIRLYHQKPRILRRYLACSPAWRVFQERGSQFATRRWKIDSHWNYSLHGYYSNHGFAQFPSANTPAFQSRLSLGFSGHPWSRATRKSTKVKPGKTRRLKLSEGNSMHQSHCVIAVDDLIIEIFEQSENKERRITKAVLRHIEEELRPLASAPQWPTIQTMLPNGGMRHGEPGLILRQSIQPGIYESEIWANPGQPGMIYLKAFEVTRNQRLTEDQLKERSNEWIGWSDDPAQLFLSNTNFTIYEGDWGKPYAARFEVWFVPDSGHGERKLFEKIFRVEGWQR